LPATILLRKFGRALTLALLGKIGMFAVIKTGGKQYLVSPGDKIKIDLPASATPKALQAGPPASLRSPEDAASLRAGEALRAGKIEGKEITFSDVLLLAYRNQKVEIGNPKVKGAKVVGKILRQGKGKKVIVFKYKAKKRYKVKKGHRQTFTEVEILKIESS